MAGRKIKRSLPDWYQAQDYSRIVEIKRTLRLDSAALMQITREEFMVMCQAVEIANRVLRADQQTVSSAYRDTGPLK